jgi:hypothetical protein
MRTIDMKMAFRHSPAWLLANAVGMCSYLLFEFWLIAPRPAELEMNGITQKYLWQIIAFPILILFFGLNNVWVVFIIRCRHSKVRWIPLYIWLLSCLAWIGVICINGTAFQMYRIATNK